MCLREICWPTVFERCDSEAQRDWQRVVPAPEVRGIIHGLLEANKTLGFCEAGPLTEFRSRSNQRVSDENEAEAGSVWHKPVSPRRQTREELDVLPVCSNEEGVLATEESLEETRAASKKQR